MAVEIEKPARSVPSPLADTLTARHNGWQRTLTRGTAVQRYIVLEQVGAGGMGVVYAARDVALQRTVALKLMRDPRRGGARLLREAQALARLSHPNVVAVYDVGTHGDQVFLAMEFVAGQTVRAWLAERPRTCRDVIAVYGRAGEGLAAAHAAGIVHRDFKPDNVLIDEAGRVRVGDFGLARLARGGSHAERTPTPAPSTGDRTLTGDGTPIGTPAYMAPEQRSGCAPVDARADQFSFCVALHEALFGHRPTVSDPDSSPPGLARASDVPAHIRRAIQRGLAVSPGDRHPSMAALLAQLRRDPRTRRRRIAAAAALLVFLAATTAGAVALRSRDGHALCRGAAGKLAGVWDGERRQAVRDAFRRSGAPDADRAWAAVEPVLDRHARSWTAMHTESCEATHLRAQQPLELLDLRTQCLDQRLADLRALIDVLAGADAVTVARASEAASSLGRVDDCSGASPLRREAPPRGSRTTELRARLARVKALDATARWKPAIEEARRLVDDARALGYRPLEADALLALARPLRRTDQLAAAEHVLYEAIAAAEAGRDADATAAAWLELVWLVGVERGRHAEAIRMAGVARGVIERLGGSGPREAQLAHIMGHLHLGMGELDLARAHAERALRMRRDLHGPADELVADSLHQLAIVHQRLGELDRALRLLLDASRIAEKRLGADHPSSLASRVARGSVLLDMGRHQEALAILEGALAPLERAAGRDTSDVMFALIGIGTARRLLEDHGRARAALERARDLARRLYGPEHLQVARVRLQLGRLLTDARKWSEARGELEASLALLQRLYAPDHWEVIEAIEDLARVDIESGRPERAIAPLERALAMRGRIEFDPYAVAFTRFELARALHRSGRAPDRVRQLVEAAHRGFEDAGAASEARDMKRWLDAPGMAEPD